MTVGDGYRTKAPVRIGLTHPVDAWAQSLKTILTTRDELLVVATSASPQWLRPAVAAHDVDVVVLHLDESFSVESAVLDEMRTVAPDIGVVALSESQDPALLRSAVEHGVRGWVEPTDSVEHMVRVLTGVHDGESWFPPRLLTSVLDGLLQATEVHEEATSVLEALSPREAEVLRCLAQGMDRREIAAKLSVSPHTVRTHVNNLLHKLDVHTTLAAVALARQVGLADKAGRSD